VALVTGRSLWDDTIPADERASFPALPGDADADVVVVGGGLTGLWSAYYLAHADPTLRIRLLERETIGFGASGRNGGWCSALLPTSLPRLARRHGVGAATRMQRAMHDTVDEIGRVTAREGIECDFVKGGTLDLARTAAQVDRIRATLADYARHGFGEDDHRWLDAGEATERCRASGVLGATFTPHCAALHPARLVHGLASAVARRGVDIHEHTSVTAFGGGRVVTDRGTVRTEVVVRATEAFSTEQRAARRELVPLYSMMIATEPLTERHWAAIGLEGRPTFDDARRMIIYGQRTADGRLAFGGRGAPYHYGSSIRPEFDTDRAVERRLTETLRALFPVLADVPITHHWGGPLGVPRDWQCSVRFDRRSGVAAAGGYVGDGVAASNLAGRTLADLITSKVTELTRLPWQGHCSPRWEFEPLRWVGIHLAQRAADHGDRIEATGRTSRLADAVDRIVLRR
jgi:glycine/D-amino acid oxidase-like deaminating enzyme